MYYKTVRIQVETHKALDREVSGDGERTYEAILTQVRWDESEGRPVERFVARGFKSTDRDETLAKAFAYVDGMKASR